MACIENSEMNLSVGGVKTGRTYVQWLVAILGK